MTDVLDELTWRGLLALSTDEQALREHLAAGPVTFYVGFDPTAPSLHFGNLVQLIVARHLQAAGHRPLILVGGSTGLIGDPKDTAERVLNSKETVAAWVQGIRRQVERYVDFTGPAAARIVNNLDWTGPMPVLDFLRDIGKHFPVNRMLARDVVRNRLEEGISYTEFSYVLLQSLDYLELFRAYGCTLQFGGSDQWGNITAGVELIRRVEGARVHAVATPLLTKADGTKFGKTESGTVWLDPQMTSPYAFHQFFLNAEDEKVIEYLKVFSPRSRPEISELARQTAEQPHLRAAQKALADDVDRSGPLAGRARGGGGGGLGAVRRRRPRVSWTSRPWPAWSPRSAGSSWNIRRAAVLGGGARAQRCGAEPRRGATGHRSRAGRT